MTYEQKDKLAPNFRLMWIRVDLEVMAIKGYSILHRYIELDLFHVMYFIFIPRKQL